MFLRFIGKDGSMGLKHGKVYHCQVNTYDGCICVYWSEKPYAMTNVCPYGSLKALTANWETVEWESQ